MDKARCYDHKQNPRIPMGCATCVRIAIEQRIVRKTVKALLAGGYALNVDNGGDTPELLDYTTDEAAILAQLMATDDEFLMCRTPAGKVAWVRFVYGNDGYDVISDYLTSLDPVLEPVIAYANTQDPSNR